MILFDQARAKLSSLAKPLPAVTLPLAQASGRRLAVDVTADIALPPHNASAMDGYAVRHADLDNQTALPITVESAAGDPEKSLPAGQVARIFTGAVVPLGADTVVKQEDAQVQNERVLLPRLEPGTHIRTAGDIFHSGATLAQEGQILTPQRMALLAAGGASRVQVGDLPKLGLVVTGAELIEVESRPKSGQIRDTNSYQLAALAAQAGLTIGLSKKVGDRLELLSASLQSALEQVDVVITSGGVSVGDYDFVPRVVTDLGGEVVFHKVKMKPGKPILVAKIGGKWLLGLPGNPDSVLCAWRLFARPLLETLSGAADAFAERPTLAHLTTQIKNRGPRLLFGLGYLNNNNGTVEVRAVPWRGSHDIAAASEANAFIQVNPSTQLEPGELVKCYPLPWHGDYWHGALW